MSSFSLTIVLLSTFMHAGWNLMVRHSQSEIQFVRRMLQAISIVGLLPAIVWDCLDPLGPTIWTLVFVSGLCCGLYFYALVHGYQTSDFTVVYPVARALPILFVALGDVLSNRWPTGWGWAGIGIVVLGCFIAPLQRIRGFHIRIYLQRSTCWMLLAAVGTTGYSLIDKASAAHMVNHGHEGPGLALRYVYYFFLSATGMYHLLLSGRAEGPSPGPKLGWIRPGLAAALCATAYAIVIWAYQMTNLASYIVACRQFSIVIAVMAAFFFFKEKGKVVRIAASVLITAGLILIAVGGD